MRKTINGFTIVELLIVVVVIAILASISVVAYTGIQDRARRSKVDDDIRNFISVIESARHSTGKNFIAITGSNYTAGPCVSKPAGTDLAALPNSDTCIAAYASALSALSAAAGVSLGDVRDPWGRPYKIDENEGESGNCLKDTVAMYALPHNGSAYHPWVGTNNIPRGGFSGCPTP